MRISLSVKAICVLSLACVLLTAGCGASGGVPAAPSEGDLQGTIVVSGAFALYPMMIRWGEEFQKLHPGVKFDISAGGAGKGMTDALSGAVDIGMVSRAITPEEESKGAFWVPVVTDSVFPTINARNPVLEDLRKKGVTQEVFRKIFVTGEIASWGEVVGRPEVTEPIHVYTRSDACGAADVWAKYLGGTQEDLKGIGVAGDPAVIDAVVSDPLGIGYDNINYAFDTTTGEPVSGAQVVPIDVNANGMADPDEIYDSREAAIAAVSAGKYPSPPARDDNLVTKGKPTGLIRAFIDWILVDGQQWVEEAGYIRLTPEKLEAARAKLEE